MLIHQLIDDKIALQFDGRLQQFMNSKAQWPYLALETRMLTENGYSVFRFGSNSDEYDRNLAQVKDLLALQ